MVKDFQPIVGSSNLHHTPTLKDGGDSSRSGGAARSPGQSRCEVCAREHDIVGGCRHGLETVAAIEGFGSPAELRTARLTHLVHSVRELAALLEWRGDGDAVLSLNRGRSRRGLAHARRCWDPGMESGAGTMDKSAHAVRGSGHRGPVERTGVVSHPVIATSAAGKDPYPRQGARKCRTEGPLGKGNGKAGDYSSSLDRMQIHPRQEKERTRSIRPVSWLSTIWRYMPNPWR